MLTEKGRVVGLVPEGAWVETVRASACQSCRLKAGCGQHAMSKLRSEESHAEANRLLLATSETLAIGEEVELSLPEQTLLKAAVALYLLPLLAMLLPVLALRSLLPEPALIALSFAGLLLGFLAARTVSKRLLRQPSCRPQLIKVTSIS